MYEKVAKEIMLEKHFGCSSGDIADTVILSPIWRLDWFRDQAEEVVREFAGWYRGATLIYHGSAVTVISSGIGAPMSGDCALALQYSDCSRVLFSGSAGALNPAYRIGDVLAVCEAVIGEGFSRYHREDISQDCFGELVEGDAGFCGILRETLERHRERLETRVFEGRLFSIDSILGETKEAFDFMLGRGCDAVEMEVSAVFTACRKAGKKAAAAILISDLPLLYRNLFEGIPEAESDAFNRLRLVLPGLLLEAAVS